MTNNACDGVRRTCPDPALIGKLLELPDGERRELVKRALEAQGWAVKLERDGITIRKKPAG